MNEIRNGERKERKGRKKGERDERERKGRKEGMREKER